MIIGTVIDDRYSLRARLGAGGMGEVYLARDLRLERPVCIKVLPTNLHQDEDARERFLREARILSELHHPNLVTFYKFATVDEGQPYIAMEYVHGKTLRQILSAQSVLDVDQAIAIVLQVCEGLSVLSKNGVTHRDIKPENIMIEDGSSSGMVKLIDFGLARTSKQAITAAGTMVGSILYMSPEQCAGMPADARSDVYSIGCVLYECLAGKVPFSADNPVAVAYKHVGEQFPMLPLESPKHAAINRVLARCTAKTATHRYPSAQDLALDLRCVLEEQEPPGVLPRSRLRISPISAAFALVAIIVLASAMFFAQHRQSPVSSPRQQAEFLIQRAEKALAEQDPLAGMSVFRGILALAGEASRVPNGRGDNVVWLSPLLNAGIKLSTLIDLSAAWTLNYKSSDFANLPHTQALKLILLDATAHCAKAGTNAEKRLQDYLIVSSLQRDTDPVQFELYTLRRLFLAVPPSSREESIDGSWALARDLSECLARREGKPLEAISFAGKACRLSQRVLPVKNNDASASEFVNNLLWVCRLTQENALLQERDRYALVLYEFLRTSDKAGRLRYRMISPADRKNVQQLLADCLQRNGRKREAAQVILELSRLD